MAKTTVSVLLPHGARELELVYVDAYGYRVTGATTGLVFLHRVRQLGERNSWVQHNAQHYRDHVQPAAAKALADYFKGRRFDAVLAPPSRRRDVLPYFEALVEELGPLEDWTDCFARADGTSAGSTRSCESLYHALTFVPRPSIVHASAVLMVDESFSSGTTACAILRHLLDAGLPDQCRLTVAAPLWVSPKPATNAD